MAQAALGSLLLIKKTQTERMNMTLRWVPYLLSALIACSAGCGAPEEELLQPFSLDRCSAPVDFKDHAAYLAAVTDAAQRNLPAAYIDAILAQNATVVWEGTPGSSRILVSTWIKHTFYDSKLGLDNQPLGGDAFITLGRTFQRCCQATSNTNGKSKAAVVRRMEELLGLPDNNGKLRVAEFWVNPSDMFRPCADPSVTTDHCERVPPPGVSADHTKWFADYQTNSYIQDASSPGYPFTGVGYTYDWGSAAKVGPSEFVVPKTALVKISALTPTEDYCGASAP